jgi:hypothetical protein
MPIRGIKSDYSNDRESFISGPLNVLKTIGKSFMSIENTKHDFYIEYSDKLEPIKWIKHHRVGLSRDKEIELLTRYLVEYKENEFFYYKPYRYIAWLQLFHSFHNKYKVMKDAYDSGLQLDVLQGAFNYTPDFLKKK